MVRQLRTSPEPNKQQQSSFDEICDQNARRPMPWIFSRSSGWRHRLESRQVSAQIRNVAASCTMVLSSFTLLTLCVTISNSAWGCSPFSSCPAKCSFLIGLGVQTALLFSLSMALFLSSARQFPASSPLSYLPSVLGATTIVTYHWVLYGTYAKIVTPVCPSARLEYAFAIVLVLGHVLLGTPSVITALIWKFGRQSATSDEQTLYQAADEDAAPMHERSSLLLHRLSDHEAC